ncbi:MAG: patatin-like phospholipase family protein [Pseudonocardiaceae bacterium]|nr:patatin-like phospholipase family protein [Pseudonocardiaceae bacterium]
MTTAFVLSGGGNLGAVQVGMLRALHERRIVPDLLVGTSVGALNAAHLAGGGLTADVLDDLAAVWRRVRRKDVFPLDPVRQLLAVAGRLPSLCSSGALRRLIADNVAHRQLEDATIPLLLVATDVRTGEPACLSTGDTVSAVLASTAIPGVFPAVERDGVALCDGAVAANAGISQAVAQHADEIYLLPAGYACALTYAPATALSAALHALSLLIQRQSQLEVAHLVGRVDLHVLPPLCPLSVAPLDFSRAAELIGRGYQATSSWLAKGSDRRPHPERYLALHDHQHDRDGPICPTAAADEPPPRAA